MADDVFSTPPLRRAPTRLSGTRGPHAAPPTRRQLPLIGGAVLFAATVNDGAAAMPNSADAAVDAAIVAYFEADARYCAFLRGLSFDDEHRLADVIDSMFREAEDALDRAWGTPAGTVAGVLTKVAAWQRIADDNPGTSWTSTAAMNFAEAALEDLVRLRA